MGLAMIEDVAADPHDVRLLRPGTVVACTDRGAEAVEEFRGLSHVCEVPSEDTQNATIYDW
jgi:hypothetical protein